MGLPQSNAEWEDFYELPRGIIEAIQTQPARGRIAQILANYRDDLLRKNGIPPTIADVDVPARLEQEVGV